ncbi:MAPEG family protein [Pseudomonas oryzae]|uniref:MAPEG family protein n=1 Tax=Pseudomonas oryzae TaxID=1392877 RepID=A0A1H1UB40_9PSED|nr:MAPEG family protein [Pseudomonas oryzae]SDS69139.1 hypothetical protein SAMN05216221_2390 [Pseudomonas oryzae]
MANTDILAPMLALIGWTLLVLLLIPWRRFRAAFAGRVSAEDFRFGESPRVPPEVSLPNRNLQNLLEVPLLFYVLCLVGYLTRQIDLVALGLAWGYVGLRVLHSLVHLTYNRVFHRFLVFAASNLLLAILWARLLPALV